MSDSLDEKVQDALLAFTDFLYAVVFGLIVADAFDKIIVSETKSYLEKISNLLLVLGVFYFLMWDWLHGRLLTLKNPYKSYRRFFIEIIIAACGYGAANRAINARVAFLVYVVLILIFGALWAGRTMSEYPRSHDLSELKVVKIYQVRYAVAVSLGALWWHLFVRQEITITDAIYFIVAGWIFVFQYEFFLYRPQGIIGGPGVPFVSHETIGKLQNSVVKFRRLIARLFKSRQGG